MIGSISSDSEILAALHASNNSSTSSLTTSQLETISSVLENYDSSNLAQSDAQAIVSTFEEAGIEPSSELENAMSSAGFDAREVGTLAGVGGQEGMIPPPPPSNEEISSVSNLLDTLLNNKDEESSTSIEDIMDYTSRILSLNEQSKEEVMDLLSQYSSEDTEYTKDEINVLLTTSLSQILSEDSNYKSVSFYG